MSPAQRASYPFRAWCPRLRRFAYLSRRPAPSFTLEVAAVQDCGEARPMPRFNVNGSAMHLGEVQRNPWHKRGRK